MKTTAEAAVRPVTELDITEITRIDEKIRGHYHPEEWETRIRYYIRRDAEGSLVAECDGKVVGFMLGEVRSGEFGLSEPTGWIEVMGIDPDYQGRAVGTRLAEQMLSHFRRRGATVVRTLVGDEMKPIRSFFESLGFEPAPMRALFKRL
ncbi:MAG: GNAT family N-acetyltransferase [Armatimonadetes bacterium]|nr:GNAT family N-acetyltransferase [Armatimonadota bacterium]